MAYELYQILELSPQASAEEIKRGYFRLVRKYSPEKEPELFKSIREAYETLSDPKAKENYDSLQKHGEEVSRLVDEAEQKMSDGEWAKAIPMLKRVLVLFPGAIAARNRLGICYTREEDWDNALKVYRKLTTDSSDIPLYWLNYGFAYKEYAESLNDENSEKGFLYQQARQQFKQAIDLEPYNSEPYLEIARTYTAQEDYSRALSWAERAVGADGKTDLQDFETLFYICIIHFHNRQFEKIQEVAQKIISLLPENDEDISKYVGSRFADFGYDIGKIGYENSNFQLLKAASSFLASARKFDSSNEDVKNAQELVDGLYIANDQFEILKADTQISPGFSRLAAFYIASNLNQEIEDKEQIFEDICTEIFSYPLPSVLKSVTKIKYNYYAIYKLNESIFDRIEQVAKDSVSESSKKQELPNKQPSLIEGFFNFLAQHIL